MVDLNSVFLVLLGLVVIIGPIVAFILIFMNYVEGKKRVTVFWIGIVLQLLMVIAAFGMKEDAINKAQESNASEISGYSKQVTDLNVQIYELTQVELKAENWINCLVDLIGQKVTDCRPTSQVYNDAVADYKKTYVK